LEKRKAIDTDLDIPNMKLNHLLLILIFCIGISPCFSQSTDLVIKTKFRKTEIPFDYVNGFIVLNVKFMDFFELKFIFDTGAEHTIITKRKVADLLNFRYLKRFTLVGADLSDELYAYLIRGVNMEMKGIRATNRSVLVLEEDYFRFEEFSGINIQGILGADFFSRFIVKINYEREVLTLYNPKFFNPPKVEEDLITLPIELFRRKPYVMADATFQNGETLPIKLLIDTGAGLSLLLHTNTHPELELPTHTITSNIGMGMGGYLEGFIGRINEFQIGPHRIPGVITSFQDLAENYDETFLNHRNGILGNQILNRFDVIIDYLNEELYLTPNRKFKNKFKFDKSGILLATSGSELNHFAVFGLINNSPAQEAGILPGDEIRRVNGIPTSFLTLEGLSNKFRKKEGKKIRLILKRDGERIKKHFILRDLI
jgi:predicted aspartyl protease